MAVLTETEAKQKAEEFLVGLSARYGGEGWRDRLWTVFTKLHDPKDWKAPICCSVTAAELPDAVRAIEFYTATPASVTTTEEGRFQVASIGYQAGPAGDH